MRRKFVGAAVFAVMIGLLAVSCEPILLYQSPLPEFKAPSDKALCVVLRPSGMFGEYAPIWLDEKCVSGTMGNTITSFEVAPGPHLVLTKIALLTKVKLNFQPGKVYYLLQAAFPIPMIGTSTSLTPMPGDEATAKIEKEKGNIKFTKLNPKQTYQDLTAGNIKEELKDYDEWTKKEPAKAKVEADYPGY